jgi:hypothetical protein
VLPFFHRGAGLPLDLVLATDGLEAAFLARACPTNLGGVRVPVIAIEDLIVAKILAGRPKDLEDVRRLLQVGTADVRRIRAALEELDDLLERVDLAPMLDALLPDRR